jgi:hypothetical protein
MSWIGRARQGAREDEIPRGQVPRPVRRGRGGNQTPESVALNFEGRLRSFTEKRKRKILMTSIRKVVWSA